MPDFDWGYAPAEAERGKFARLTTAELSSLGMSTTASRGRYVVLTYPVAPITVAFSGNVTVDMPNSVEVASTTLNNVVVSAITFTNTSHTIEIYNNSDVNTVYLYYSTTTAPTLTSRGMIILPYTFYSVEHNTKNLWMTTVGPSATTDVRIFNRYS